MKCVKCEAEIRCKLSIKTEEDDRPIEINYQWWSCENCGTKYFAILEDSNVNMFDDRLLHKGYLADTHKWQESINWAMKCPKSNNSACNCEVHKTISSSNFYGESAWYTYE
ncbi:MAG TPA: hypothetical protein DCQ31_14085 [Bacteroidales bacterium]|nr:hypothetical protein [Bacteroidales bacterium]